MKVHLNFFPATSCGHPVHHQLLLISEEQTHESDPGVGTDPDTFKAEQPDPSHEDVDLLRLSPPYKILYVLCKTNLKKGLIPVPQGIGICTR